MPKYLTNNYENKCDRFNETTITARKNTHDMK